MPADGGAGMHGEVQKQPFHRTGFVPPSGCTREKSLESAIYGWMPSVNARRLAIMDPACTGLTAVFDPNVRLKRIRDAPALPGDQHAVEPV